MKRLLIVGFIFLILLKIIPEKQAENPVLTEEETIKEIENRIEETSNRSDIVREVATVEKNLNLTVDSDLRIVSNLTAEEFDKMLEGTELCGIGKALSEIEKIHSINGLYIMGLACLESGYGTSAYARNRNNLVGWNATDSNPNGATYFSSKSECIYYVANKMKANYLTENGKFFNGYTARAIDVKYCSDKQHADKIVIIVNRLIKKL